MITCCGARRPGNVPSPRLVAPLAQLWQLLRWEPRCPMRVVSPGARPGLLAPLAPGTPQAAAAALDAPRRVCARCLLLQLLPSHTSAKRD